MRVSLGLETLGDGIDQFSAELQRQLVGLKEPSCQLIDIVVLGHNYLLELAIYLYLYLQSVLGLCLHWLLFDLCPRSWLWKPRFSGEGRVKAIQLFLFAALLLLVL